MRARGFAGVCGSAEAVLLRSRECALKVSSWKPRLVAAETDADNAQVFAFVRECDVAQRFFFSQIANHIDDEQR